MAMGHIWYPVEKFHLLEDCGHSLLLDDGCNRRLTFVVGWGQGAQAQHALYVQIET